MKKSTKPTPKTTKQPALKQVVLALEERIKALEARPDILHLDPETQHILIFKNTVSGEEFEQLQRELSRFQNLIALEGAGDVKVIKIE